MHQIAELVCEITIVALGKTLRGEIAIFSKANFSEQEKSKHVIIPILFYHIEWINHVAKRFRHLISIDRKKSVSENFFGKRKTR